MDNAISLETSQPRLRYRDFREKLLEIRARHWFIYYKGQLSVAREYNREIDLMARLVYGLQQCDKILAMQVRNREGVVEYQLYPLAKLLGEDLEEAMQVTAERPVQYVSLDAKVTPHPERGIGTMLKSWRDKT